MPNARIARLLKGLEDSPVHFDPTFDHHYGTITPVPRVAFVPLDLLNDLKACLSSLLDNPAAEEYPETHDERRPPGHYGTVRR